MRVNIRFNSDKTEMVVVGPNSSLGDGRGCTSPERSGSQVGSVPGPGPPAR